ncbi:MULTISPECIES: branched-chain amino acid ABC transporter permease [Phyllobacteriaceae]|uniref:branched-chain amino acid ABC transporter permease n=1 Tax=Phyllobacteriaceae TaxID=69277 RepID=UPI002ACA9D8D|nr:branched-chain amino acid ABC transporter permease [Chelativorans sp. M5D2P16]MDZ5696549.1 branched-chain amino acid ABC transporter permease [Chelativorans sp. M5D2P16]
MDFSLLLEPAILTEVLVQGLVRGAMYALMASGLSLIFGIMGVKNFSHGELFMLGTYAMFFVTVVLGWPWPLGIAFAALALFVFGMLLERTLIETLRRRAGRDWLLDAFILTIGMLVVMQNLALIIFGTERRGVTSLVDGVLVWGPVIVSYERLMVLAVASGVGLALWAFIRFSSLGKAIRAAAQDPDAAQTLGIDIRLVYTITFGIGAALAGLAGGLLISIYPAHPTVGFQPVIKSIACVILGGLGNVPGAIIAALLLGIIEAYSTFFMSAGWQNVVTAALVVIILIVRPSGLFSSSKVERA